MSNDGDVYDDQYYLNLPVDSDRIDILRRLLDFGRGDKVCEIGCAAGHFLAAIAPDIGSGIGIDTAAAAIRAAQRIRDESGHAHISFEQVSAQDFVRQQGRVASFDYVLLLDVTEHINDQVLADVLRAAHQLLKPGGQLVVHTPNLAYWLETLKDKGILRQLDGHIAVRNEKHYRELLRQAGFDQLRIEGLAHYRQPLRLVDSVLLGIPYVGRVFRSRLFITATKAAGAEGTS